MTELEKLKIIAKASTKQTAELEKYQRALLAHSDTFKVKLKDLQAAIAEYYKDKHGLIAELITYQLTRAVRVDSNKDADGYFTQRTFFHLQTRKHPLDWCNNSYLFSLDTSKDNIADKDYEINLLTSGFLSSFIKKEENSKIDQHQNDFDEIGWQCIEQTQQIISKEKQEQAL